MNQDQFNTATSNVHSTINDFTNLGHNLVDVFLDNSMGLMNNINTNLGSNNIITKNKKICPNYNIINDKLNKYSLILLVHLPGCSKNSISTKLNKNILYITGKTEFSCDNCLLTDNEIIYEIKFNLPISENIENHLKIKYLNGTLRILVENNNLNNAKNIQID